MKHMVLAALFLAVALAGCSDGTDPNICGTQDDEGRYVVCMTSNFQFTPKELTVPAGATVVWVQQSSTPHNAHAYDGSFESPFLRDKGEEWAHTFTEAGVVEYKCDPHEFSNNMVGTITVE